MTVEKPKANVNIDEEEKEEVRLYVGLLGFKHTCFSSLYREQIDGISLSLCILTIRKTATIIKYYC